MTPELEAKLRTLEDQLADDPSSESLREAILFEYLGPGLSGEPRRIHHIVECVRRFPRTSIARCPFVHVDQVSFPAAFAQIEQEWLRLQAEHPGDPEIAQGHSALVAPGDPGRAVELLEQALHTNPQDPGLWLEMGRVCPEPSLSLKALEKARALGASQPNLLTWLARAALGADDVPAAERVGTGLLSLVEQARSVHGEKLDWSERGRELWARAQAASDNDEDARVLTGAIADHANRKHWGHTTLGVLAARAGDVSAARQHLRESVAARGDFRLSSYGPSFLLARELCALGAWDAVADYLSVCASFWNPEPLQGWLQKVRAQQMPEFFEQ